MYKQVFSFRICGGNLFNSSLKSELRNIKIMKNALTKIVIKWYFLWKCNCISINKKNNNSKN